MSLPVLVVEDNNINRDVAVLQLKALGFQAVLASDGMEALDAVKTKQFAMIMMDVMMPAMDGWEAARRIREYEHTVGRHTPIVGVSAWSASDNKEKCLSAGMDDYLSKPYDRAQLKSVLDRWANAQQTV